MEKLTHQTPVIIGCIPFIPDGYKIDEHHPSCEESCKWDPAVKTHGLYLTPLQDRNFPTEIVDVLENINECKSNGRRFFCGCVLSALMLKGEIRQERIPISWKEFHRIFFWNTVYIEKGSRRKGRVKNLYVLYLERFVPLNGHWDWGHCCINNEDEDLQLTSYDAAAYWIGH